MMKTGSDCLVSLLTRAEQAHFVTDEEDSVRKVIGKNDFTVAQSHFRHIFKIAFSSFLAKEDCIRITEITKTCLPIRQVKKIIVETVAFSSLLANGEGALKSWKSHKSKNQSSDN